MPVRSCSNSTVRRIDPLSAARRGIGRTFQNNALFKKMSVIDNMLTGLSRHLRSSFIEQALGLPRARREAQQLRQQARAFSSSSNCRPSAMCRWATCPTACKNAWSWAVP
jgi:ABC-type branched-subunit amino acid transport system ATPase component